MPLEPTLEIRGVMRLGQFIDREPVVRRKRKGNTPTIAQHPIFVPLITIWGGALMGLAILVMPQSAIHNAGASAGLGAYGAGLRFGLGGACALLGGGLGFMVSRMIHNKASAARKTTIAATFAKRKLQPINPFVDLGSTSLDAPLDEPAGGNVEPTPIKASVEAQFEEMEAHDQEAGHQQAGDHELPASVDTKAGPDEAPAYKNADSNDAPGQEAQAKESANQQLAFTHKQYQQALIESCEASWDGDADKAEPGNSSVTAAVQNTQDTQVGAGPDGQAIVEPGPNNAGPNKPGPNKPGPRGASKPAANAPGSAWSLTQVSPGKLTPPPVPTQRGDESSDPHFDKDGAHSEISHNTVPLPQNTGPKPRSSAPASLDALEKLRQIPTSELSLVQMVERFAGALHEHQNTGGARVEIAHHGRDAALVEALKALTLFTESGFDRASGDQLRDPLSGAGAPEPASARANETEEDLRRALVKLQSLRGAA